MAFPVTLNGRTYTLADFAGTNYVEGLPDAFEDFVTQAGSLYSTTSTTSNTIGTGSKTFTVESSKPYQVGTPLRIADTAAPSTNWIDGIVTAYSGTTLTVNAVAYAGSGTKTAWSINIGGGPIAYTGTLPVAQGGTGATTAADARTNLDVYSKSEADGRYLNISGDTADVSFGANMTFGDNNKAIFGAGSDLQIYHDGTDSIINEGTAGNFLIQGSAIKLQTANGLKDYLVANASAEVTLYYDNAAKLATTDTGVDVTGTLTSDGLTVDGDLTVDTNTLYVDSTNNRVGIGTSSPAQPLTIQATTPIIQLVDSDLTTRVANIGGDNGNVTIDIDPAQTAASSFFSVDIDDSERMRIDSSGNVGIGLSTPTAPLHVSSSGTGAEDIFRVSNVAGGAFQVRCEDLAAANPTWTLRTFANEPMAFAISTTEAMRINSSGNVGIGTTSPQYLGHFVDGDVAIVDTDATNNAEKQSLLFGGASGESASLAGITGYRGASSSEGELIFKTNGGSGITERMRIDNSGNALMGGSNLPDAFPANNTSGYGVTLLANPNQKGRIAVLGDDDCGLNVGRHTGTGNVAQWYYSGSIVGSVSVTASATAYNTSSDYRLKEDVQPMVGATDRLMALNPVNFAWKADGSRVDGFLAHEAQEVVPEAVTGSKDAVDAEGNPEYQGIDQSKLVPLLTAALQEALQKIETLESRIAALEA